MDDWMAHVFSFLNGRHSLEPTTNAGRYLRQLDRGEQAFRHAQEHIDPELECALRRVAIVSRRQQA